MLGYVRAAVQNLGVGTPSEKRRRGRKIIKIRKSKKTPARKIIKFFFMTFILSELKISPLCVSRNYSIKEYEIIIKKHSEVQLNRTDVCDL